MCRLLGQRAGMSAHRLGDWRRRRRGGWRCSRGLQAEAQIITALPNDLLDHKAGLTYLSGCCSRQSWRTHTAKQAKQFTRASSWSKPFHKAGAHLTPRRMDFPTTWKVECSLKSQRVLALILHMHLMHRRKDSLAAGDLTTLSEGTGLPTGVKAEGVVGLITGPLPVAVPTALVQAGSLYSVVPAGRRAARCTHAWSAL